MQKGFTIIELLVVIAIVAIIASMGFEVYKVAQAKNQMALAVNTLAFDLRKAQISSQAVDGDSAWGVKIQNKTAIIFKGTSYALRDVAADDQISLPGQISTSGLNEIVFSKMSGLPQATGIITLTGLNNDTKTITINSKGTVSY